MKIKHTIITVLLLLMMVSLPACSFYSGVKLKILMKLFLMPYGQILTKRMHYSV